MLRRAVVLSACLLAFLSATPAFAQDGKASHWGVIFSFTPTWKANQTFQDLFLVEDVNETFEGSEFTIGVARGSTLGGNWGVSYVRKSIKDGFTTTSSYSQSEPNFTFQSTLTNTFQKTYYEGVEVHLFVPFANIKNRVQIGLNVAGGVGFPKGNVYQVYDSTTTNTFPGFPPTVTHQHDEMTQQAKDVILSIQPLGKVEAQGSIIVTPAFKINVSGGLNLPSVAAFRIGAVYLIGAK
jgi:hypothetical protein